MKTLTVIEWAKTKFGGIGGLSPAQTGFGVGRAAAANFVLVTISFEVGAGAGSAVNASTPRNCGCVNTWFGFQPSDIAMGAMKFLRGF